MSNWTHVNVAILLDYIPIDDERELPNLGKMVSYEDIVNLPDDMDNCPTIIPCGSEGSLHYNISKINSGSIAWLAIHIWGDLRDYDEVEPILEYLNGVCSNQLVRNGVGSIKIESSKTIEYIVKCDDSRSSIWTIYTKINEKSEF